MEDMKVQFNKEGFRNKWPNVVSTSCWQRLWLIKDNITAHLNGLMD